MDQPRTTSRDALLQQAEELLAHIVDLAADVQEVAVLELCREHAPLAVELRELWNLHRKLLGPPDPSTTPGGEPFGPFQLLRPLGSGGMGTVWLARQQMQGADRLVAIKTVRSAGLFSKEARERFRREARALFRVDHPGICPIYDVGEVDGTPYLAMRYVPGRSLAEVIGHARENKTALDLPRTDSDGSSTQTGSSRTDARGRFDVILSLIESIARALHAAHETGLVHRDVKPGNVMITPAGEPVLLDFGLARTAGEDSDLTVTGAPIGTPAYMSPEQVGGQHAQMDRTTDVWSLAVTAYECLTLETPFRAETREGIYRRILADDPLPLRRFDGSWPRDLDVVISTALRKQPDRRYRTALEFADDLAAVRRMLPTRARHTGAVERTNLWVRRNPAVSALLLMLAIALAAAVVFAVQAGHRADEAERSRRLAEDSFDAARTSIEQVTDITRNKLDEVPGFTPQLTVMLESCIEFYTRFAELRESDPSLALDVSRAWQSIGELENIAGHFAKSEAAFGQALQHLMAGVESGKARKNSATRSFITSRLGSLAARDGRLESGLELLREAIAIAAAAERERPDDPASIQAWIDAQTTLVSILINLGRDEEALRTCSEAIDAKGTIPEVTGKQDLVVSFARLYGYAAKLEARVRQYEAAEHHYAAAIDALEPLVTEDARPLETAALLAVQLDDRAQFFADRGRSEDSLSDRRRALAIGEQLVTAHPDSYQFAVNLGGVYANLGGTLAGLGEVDEAIRSVEKGRARLRQVLSTRSGDRFATLQLAIATLGLGDIASRRREMESAATYFREVLTTLDTIEDPSGKNFDFHRLRARAAMSLGTCLIADLEFEDAERSLALAEEEIETLMTESPAPPRLVADKALVLHNRALVAAALDQQELSADRFAEAAEWWLRCLPTSPRPTTALPQITRDLARASLARMFVDTTRASAAADSAMERIDAVDSRWLTAIADDPRYLRDRRTLELVVAVAEIDVDPVEARRRLNACAVALEQLPRQQDRDWLSLLGIFARVSALRTSDAQEAPRADEVDGLQRALEELAAAELPPFPDLKHLCQKGLHGARAVVDSLGKEQRAVIERAIDAAQKRLDGDDH